MKRKNKAFDIFKIFQNEVQNQIGKKIKTIQLDRVGEYIGYEFDEHIKNYDIVSQLTPPGTPQHNGVLERRKYTLLIWYDRWCVLCPFLICFGVMPTILQLKL